MWLEFMFFRDPLTVGGLTSAPRWSVRSSALRLLALSQSLPPQRRFSFFVIRFGRHSAADPAECWRGRRTVGTEVDNLRVKTSLTIPAPALNTICGPRKLERGVLRFCQTASSYFASRQGRVRAHWIAAYPSMRAFILLARPLQIYETRITALPSSGESACRMYFSEIRRKSNRVPQ